jgi:hypothetical protein
MALGTGATLDTDGGVRFGGDQVEVKADPDTFANGDLTENGVVFDLEGDQLRVRARTEDGTVRSGTIELEEALSVEGGEDDADGAPTLPGTLAANAHQIPYHSLDLDGDVSGLADVPAIDVGSDFATFNADPDATGSVWLLWDRQHLYLTADVHDDEHVNPFLGDKSWRGDGFQIGVAPSGADSETTFQELNVALGPTGPRVYAGTQPTDDVPYKRVMAEADAVVERDDGEDRTVYEVAIPWDALPVDPDDRTFGCSIGLNDRDEGTDYRLQEWSSGIYGGKDASQFRRCTLTSA